MTLVTDKKILDTISSNFKKHIEKSRRHKKPRLESWKKVDDMMANRKIDFGDSVVHVPLGKANGFMKTWLSKIDNPLTFKYKWKEMGDMRKAEILNSIRTTDKTNGRWDWKDLMGKKQAGKYGRAIYFYTARSPKGKYESELSIIDVIRFHIDPRAGEDKEKARWMGWGGVEFTREELEDGVKDEEFLKENTESLLAGTGNQSKVTLEDRYLNQRYVSINSTGKPEDSYDEDVWVFHRWFETINNQRYTCLITEEGTIVSAKKIEDEWASGLYPVWTWASNPDVTEFWTLGDVEYQMYVFIAQEASISQMLENGDKVNKPQRAINIERVKNPAQAKYRRDSFIEIDGEGDVSQAIMDMKVPPLEAPMMIYDKMEQISASESGVTPSMKGLSDQDKVGIYEGDLQQAGDIFGLLNKSYAEGYWYFAQLHKAGVMEHLTKAMAVEIAGESGLAIEKVTKRDVKSKMDYDILIESSNAEAQSNNVDKKNKITFLSGYKGDANVNQKVLFEYGAGTAGFSDEEIERMLDVSGYSTQQVVADAHEVYQKLLKGEADEYEGANTEFITQIMKLYWKYRSDIDPAQAMRIESYIEEHMPIVQDNMARNLVKQVSQMGMVTPPPTGGGQGGNLGKLGENLADPNAVSGALDINNKGGGTALQPVA